jgi:hypothetical protein
MAQPALQPAILAGRPVDIRWHDTRHPYPKHRRTLHRKCAATHHDRVGVMIEAVISGYRLAMLANKQKGFAK